MVYTLSSEINMVDNMEKLIVVSCMKDAIDVTNSRKRSSIALIGVASISPNLWRARG
jgi:hypothetical protein